MSSIDPSSGSSGPSGPTGPEEPTGPTGATGATGGTGASSPDTIGRATSPYYFTPPTFPSNPTLPMPGSSEGRIHRSLLEYAQLMSITTANQQSQTDYMNAYGMEVYKDVWLNMISNAQLIRQFYNNVSAIHNNQQTIAQTQQTANDQITPAISAYNSQNDFAADQAATDAMNQAITDYNNGTIDQTQYNTAVATYNSYVSTHNSQTYVTDYASQAAIYNAQVATINDSIDATNLLRAQTNLPPLPHVTPLPDGTLPQATTAPPATPPVPAIENPPSTIPNAAPPIDDPSLKSLLKDSGYKDYAKRLKKGIDILTDQLSSAEEQNKFNKFNIEDIGNVQINGTTSASYVDDKQQGSAAPSAGTASASSGFTSMAQGLGSDSTNRVLGANIYASACKDAQTPPYLADMLTAANLSIGQSLGLLSGPPGFFPTFDGQLNPKAGGAPTNLLIALGYTTVIRDLINSQQLSGNIGNLLATNGVSEGDLEALTKTITAGFQLSQIQQAIFRIASALGLPGSVAQVLGNVAGIPNLDSVMGSAANATPNDVLQNPAVVESLKNNLTTQLTITNPEIDGLKAAQIMNDAVDSAIAAGNVDSAYAFGAQLQETLINAGLQSDAAIAAGVQSQALVNSEVSESYLNQNVVQSSVGDSIQNSDIIDQQVVQTAVLNSSVQGDALLARSIRDDILKQQTINGYTFQAALKQSNELAALLTGNRLAQEFSAQIYNEGLLQKSLSDGIARAGGPPGLADSISSNVLQSELQSSAEVRNSIYGQLAAAGLSEANAQAIAANAQLVSNGADPYASVGGGASLQSPAEIGEKIRAAAYEQLKAYYDNPTAMSVAQQLANAVVGPPTNNDIAYDDLTSPTSLLRQANDQVAALNEAGDTKIMDAVRESFRDTMRTTTDLAAFVRWLDEPGSSLIMAMSLMNADHGKRPTNFQRPTDVAV